MSGIGTDIGRSSTNVVRHWSTQRILQVCSTHVRVETTNALTQEKVQRAYT